MAVKAPHLLKGEQVEALACEYLQAQGLKFIQKNYRLRTGEIDLIMQDSDILVFIEVRYRKNQNFGGALASIDPRKQARIIHTAQYYLNYHAATHMQVRFDVIAVESSHNIQWIKNAFDGG